MYTLIVYRPSFQIDNCLSGCCGSSYYESFFVYHDSLSLEEAAEIISDFKYEQDHVFIDEDENLPGEKYQFHCFLRPEKIHQSASDYLEARIEALLTHKIYRKELLEKEKQQAAEEQKRQEESAARLQKEQRELEEYKRLQLKFGDK